MRLGLPFRHRALMVSTLLAYAAGAIVALTEAGPILFGGFKRSLNRLAISAVIGITAGLSDAV